MADEEHLARIQQGVKSWNAWRRQTPDLLPDLSHANLQGRDLGGADLTWACLSNANLSRANLYSANLHHANLQGANLQSANLRAANLSQTKLNHCSTLCHADCSEASFRGADLSHTDLSGANFFGVNFSYATFRKAILNATTFIHANLSYANLARAVLQEANLSYANLTRASLGGSQLLKADLSHATLSGACLLGTNLNYADLTSANLRYANLAASQALATRFTAAMLTGACIDSWQINRTTQLDDVVCDYIYLKSEWSTAEKLGLLFYDRRPSDPHQCFASGEFTVLFQVPETIDLVFGDGIDWSAFFRSFQTLQTQYGENCLSIQAIEKKSSQAFVIRLQVSASVAFEMSKAALEQKLKCQYDMEIQSEPNSPKSTSIEAIATVLSTKTGSAG